MSNSSYNDQSAIYQRAPSHQEQSRIKYHCSKCGDKLNADERKSGICRDCKN